MPSQAQSLTCILLTTGYKSKVPITPPTPTQSPINLLRAAHRTQETRLLTRLVIYYKGYWRIRINSKMKRYIRWGLEQRNLCPDVLWVIARRYAEASASLSWKLAKPPCFVFSWRHHYLGHWWLSQSLVPLLSLELGVVLKGPALYSGLIPLATSPIFRCFSELSLININTVEVEMDLLGITRHLFYL